MFNDDGINRRFAIGEEYLTVFALRLVDGGNCNLSFAWHSQFFFYSVDRIKMCITPPSGDSFDDHSNISYFVYKHSFCDGEISNLVIQE